MNKWWSVLTKMFTNWRQIDYLFIIKYFKFNIVQKVQISYGGSNGILVSPTYKQPTSESNSFELKYPSTNNNSSLTQ